MKETFDELFGFLHGIKTYVIDTNNLSLMWSYTQIEKKVRELQDKYNESIQKESVGSKDTEMTALEYLKEQKRMCDSASDSSCTGCLIHIRKGDMTCLNFQQKCPEQAIAVVEQWSNEHPKKTILQDFLEKYPYAKLAINGVPKICPHYLGYAVNDCFYDMKERVVSNYNCKKCWDKPLEEVK